jgi:hypothetical protein
MHKLSLYGISGNLHKWINTFVTGRRQCVQVNGASSTWINVKSGVPQGSVLGPLLFLLYVNDIPATLNCDVLMFADDIKIWKSIESVGDSIGLQGNLDALQDWSDIWLLPFNTSKCSTLSINSNQIRDPVTYTLNGAALPAAFLEKDLGVIVHNSLKPSMQCAKVATTAMSIMRRIKRTFPAMSPDLFGKIYGCFVRSHLEYAIQSWMPWFQKDRVILENVQRRSTKLVEGLGQTNFQARERILNLFPLSYRQLRGDLILCFKIIRVPDFSLRIDNFFSLSGNTQLRGHPWKLKKERSNTIMRQAFFSQRVISHWNNLPYFVVSSQNIEIFKSRLDKYMSEQQNLLSIYV